MDKKGKTRLFLTQGTKDGLTRKKLVQFIKGKTNIHDKKIEDIKLLDKFAFITLPLKEAEIVLASFKKGKKRSGLLIQKAKKGKVR